MMFLLAIFISLQAYAGLLTFETGGAEISNVQIAKAAQVSVANRSYKLEFVGAALRWKKVAFFKPDVYVGQFFVTNESKFSRNSETALDSLDAMKAVAMTLTFLRDVEAKKIYEAFVEGLKENKVNLEDPTIQGFLKSVKEGPEAKKHSTLVILGEIEGPKQSIYFENAEGKIVQATGDSGLVKKIFSLWLGKMPDSGLEEFQKNLLKK